MGFLKRLGNRLLYFIVGLILTIVGALLIYAEFSSSHPWNVKTSYYPFVVFIIGIASIWVAFDKPKDKEVKDEDKMRPVQ